MNEEVALLLWYIARTIQIWLLSKFGMAPVDKSSGFRHIWTSRTHATYTKLDLARARGDIGNNDLTKRNGCQKCRPET